MGLFGPKQQMSIDSSILPDAAKKEISAGSLPHINTDKIFLKNGEYCCYIDKAILNVHVKNRITKRVGTSVPGLFKGDRISGGYSKPIEYEQIEQYKGILYITNKRVIFQSSKHAFDKQHRYLSSIAPFQNAVELQYGSTIYELIVADGGVVNQVLQLI